MAPHTASDGGDVIERFEAAIDAAVGAGIAGVQARLCVADHTWAVARGVRALDDATPPSTDDRFWIGSTSKPFTAVVLLQLADEGRLDLDAPVADVIGDLGLDAGITARMLLQHRSGLYNYR